MSNYQYIIRISNETTKKVREIYTYSERNRERERKKLFIYFTLKLKY